jgi:3,4-dihydroxy 2-butanone 4-phosphate synthase/GTP cyclohydrolase II
LFFAAVTLKFDGKNGLWGYQERYMDINRHITEILQEAQGYRRRTGRPYVTLTYAQSLDGSIAARPGHPLALSCREAQVMTHALRAAHDAILVGIGTVLADNPSLTVRLAPGKNPQPVILDSRLRFPLYAKLLQQNGPLPWIAAGSLVEPEREATLAKLGVQVHRLPTGRQSLIDLIALLELLGNKGINSLMVEGGAQIITNFLTSRLVDQVVVTIAPVVVGGVRVVDNLGFFNSGHFPRLSRVTYQQVGEDLVIRGEPAWPGP